MKVLNRAMEKSVYRGLTRKFYLYYVSVGTVISRLYLVVYVVFYHESMTTCVFCTEAYLFRENGGDPSRGYLSYQLRLLQTVLATCVPRVCHHQCVKYFTVSLTVFLMGLVEPRHVS